MKRVHSARLTRALDVARKGDRIILVNTGEPYRESVTLQGGRHSGYPDAPFEIVGNGAVLDGVQPVPVDAWTIVEGNLFRFQPIEDVVSGFVFGWQTGRAAGSEKLFKTSRYSNHWSGVCFSSTSISALNRIVCPNRTRCPIRRYLSVSLCMKFATS